MNFDKIFIFILIFIVPGCLLWTDLIDFGKNIQPKSFITDSVQGFHHILVKNSHNIEYWKLTLDRKFITKQIFDDPLISHYLYGKIISDNSQNLYIVITAILKENNLRILLFSESSDYGKTWTNPTQIMKNENLCDRQGEAIFIVQETGRIFLFYHKNCTMKDEFISFVSRPQGSALFTNEQDAYKIEFRDNLEPSVTATYETIENGITKIHLFWTEYNATNKKQFLLYTDSINNGINWENSRNIINGSPCGFFPLSIYANTNFINPGLFAFYRDDLFFESRLINSLDFGKNFNLLTKSKLQMLFTVQNGHAHNMAVCGSPKNPILFLASTDFQKIVILQKYELNTGKSEFIDTPFNNFHLASEILISCVTNENEGKIIVFMLLFAEKNILDAKLYFTQETFNLN